MSRFPPNSIIVKRLVKNMKWYNARGNLSFRTNNTGLAEHVLNWSDGASRYELPKCFADLQDADEAKQLFSVISEAHEHDLARTAFAAEVEAEMKEETTSDPFDEVFDEEDIGHDAQNG